MRRILFCMLEAAEGGLYLLEVPEVPEGVRRVLLCILEAVEGELCLLEVLEVMRCVLLCMLEAVNVRSVYGGVGSVGGAGVDTLCVTLYAGGCGG